MPPTSNLQGSRIFTFFPAAHSHSEAAFWGLMIGGPYRRMWSCRTAATCQNDDTMIPPRVTPVAAIHISLFITELCKTKLIYEIYGKIHTKNMLGWHWDVLGYVMIHETTSHRQAQLSNFCPHQAISQVTLPSEVILHEGKRGQDLWLPSLTSQKILLLGRPLAGSFKSISWRKSIPWLFPVCKS